jgi:hypothetical protein
MRLNQMAPAEHIATVAASALASRISLLDVQPEELSLFGTMNLVLALIRARENDRPDAKEITWPKLAKRQTASEPGADWNDFNWHRVT